MNLLRSSHLIALAGLAVAALSLSAQQKKEKAKPEPQTWEEKAAARFTGPSEEQAALIDAAVPKVPTAKPAKERRILVFYRCETFIHTSIPFANHALVSMGKRTGAYEADLADQYEVFTPENLAKYDLICFNNTTSLKPNDAQKAAILDFVKSGKGIAGIHAAADNFGDWPEGLAMMGGVFNGHPWTAGGTWAFKVDDPAHTLTAAFGGKGFWHQDEIYWYKPESFEGRDKLRVLVSLDMSRPENQKAVQNEKFKDKFTGTPEDIDVAVSWCHKVGDGRVFYTNIGHRDETFWNSTMLQHYLDGIQYALGDLSAEEMPVKGLKAAPAPETPPAPAAK